MPELDRLQNAGAGLSSAVLVNGLEPEEESAARIEALAEALNAKSIFVLTSADPDVFPSHSTVVHPSEIHPSAESLSFSLRPAELFALLKPLTIAALLPKASELYVCSASVRVGERPLPLEDMGQNWMTLFPSVPPAVARRLLGQPRLLTQAVLPTTHLLRVRESEQSEYVFRAWFSTMSALLLDDPSSQLDAFEASFLNTLPSIVPGVGWDLSGRFSRRPDLSANGKSSFLHSIEPGPPADLADSPDSHARLHEGPLYASGSRPSLTATSIHRAVDPFGTRWRTPTDDLSEDSFAAWLEVTDSRGLPRWAQALYWARNDLRRAFPAKDTTVDSLVHWMVSNALGPSVSDTPAVHRSLAQRAMGRAARWTRTALGTPDARLASRRETPLSVAPGANVLGYLSAETGLGESGRATLRALARLGIPTAPIDVSERVLARTSGTTRAEVSGAPFDVTIAHVNPLELLAELDLSLQFRVAASWIIGSFFWETDRVPAIWRPAFDVVDELWTGSEFIARAMATATRRPISVVGMAIEPPSDLNPVRARFGIPENAFTVGFIGDAASGFERKNPVALASAFRKAFGPDFDDVVLVLKINGLFRHAEHRAELESALRGIPNVLLDQYMDRDVVWELLGCLDVYASLHRSEGFGLTIAEAMSIGLPVMVTDFGGSRDFANQSNSLAVDFRLVPAHGGPGGVYEDSGQWADPDLDQAVDHLRELQSTPSLRQALGAAGKAHISEFYSMEAYQRRLADRLSAIGVTPQSE